MTSEDLRKRFTYHPPRPENLQSFERIRQEAHAYAQTLRVHCPESRELSLAITHLEEVVFWANASIARAASKELEPGLAVIESKEQPR